MAAVHCTLNPSIHLICFSSLLTSQPWLKSLPSLKRHLFPTQRWASKYSSFIIARLSVSLWTRERLQRPICILNSVVSNCPESAQTRCYKSLCWSASLNSLILGSADHSLTIRKVGYGSNKLSMNLWCDWWYQNLFYRACLRWCGSHSYVSTSKTVLQSGTEKVFVWTCRSDADLNIPNFLESTIFSSCPRAPIPYLFLTRQYWCALLLSLKVAYLVSPKRRMCCSIQCWHSTFCLSLFIAVLLWTPAECEQLLLLTL
jgi:hypothetical protein